jgi:hypothetical protein
MSTRSKTEVYVPDFPGQLKSLRQTAGESEPSAGFGLWVLLSRNGVRLNWGDTEVLSGQALQFLYSRDPALAEGKSTIAPLDALARALGVLWNEITPSSSLKAYEIACQWLDEGVPFLARFRQPMIVWGYEKGIFESELKILRLEYHLPDQSLSRIECDRFDWRLQIDEGNSLLRVSHVESLTPDWMELLPIVVRRAIANWRHEPLDGVEIGLSAYKQFAEDLRNPQVDFADHGFPSWMGPLLYRQIQSKTHLHQFLDRLAPRYGGKPRQVLAKASTGFGQSGESWKEFAKHLGRVYERQEQGKSLRGPDTHVNHWRDQRRREEAARLVDQAALWEARAISELAKLLGT